MKRFILIAFAALAIGLSAEAQFSYRTTGEGAHRILTLRPTNTSIGVPSLSDTSHVKFWVPDTGHAGYNAGNIYISQNGGPWTLLSSFVGSGAVTSVFNRTGAVQALLADYDSFYAATGQAEVISGAWVYTNTGSSIVIRPSSAPAANTRVFTIQTTGTTTNVAWIDEEGDASVRTLSFTGSQAANLFFATPDGSSGVPSLRVIASGDLPDNGVTMAKLADLATDRLIGRDTAGTGDPEALTVGGGIEFTGSGGIQTSAFTGDVTKTAGGTSTTIANNAVSNAKLRDSVAVSLIGRAAGTDGDPGDVVCAGNGHVFWRTSNQVQCSALDATALPADGYASTYVNATGDQMTGDLGIGTAPSERLHILSSTAFKPVLRIENTNADANPPSIMFTKTSASPADGDEIGQIGFRGRDAGSTETLYCYWLGKSAVVADTDESGGMTLFCMIDGVQRNMIDVKGYNGTLGQGEVIVNEDGRDVDFRVEALSAPNAFVVEGSSGNISTTGSVRISASGAPITGHLSNTASLDYGSAGANTCAVLTLTVTGAVDGNVVTVGVPNALAAHNTSSTFFAWVSTSNTVSVRRCVIAADGSDPAAATVRADVWQH